jgi:hypothetical protein
MLLQKKKIISEKIELPVGNFPSQNQQLFL